MTQPRRASRQVDALTYAAPCLRPKFIPIQKSAKGSKGAGLRYERAVAKALPQATYGQWFQFLDRNGAGWCQPDILLVGKKRVLVLECKLTLVDEAFRQLSGLYVPVVQMAYPQHEVLAGIVCKNLTPQATELKVVETLEELIAAARPEVLPVLHWLGTTPIAGPTKRKFHP